MFYFFLTFIKNKKIRLVRVFMKDLLDQEFDNSV